MTVVSPHASGPKTLKNRHFRRMWQPGRSTVTHGRLLFFFTETTATNPNQPITYKTQEHTQLVMDFTDCHCHWKAITIHEPTGHWSLRLNHIYWINSCCCSLTMAKEAGICRATGDWKTLHVPKHREKKLAKPNAKGQRRQVLQRSTELSFPMKSQWSKM